MIYFVTCKRANAVKIGSCFGPPHYVHKRVSMLQVGCPFRLELAGVQNGFLEDERALHERFADQHIHGEWFLLSEEIERHLETLDAPEPRNMTPRAQKLSRKWSRPEPEIAA
jgi:hypothetical protein